MLYPIIVDDSKFGQKLMEKYGWSKGKGLGVKEDGMVEHVKVGLKTDQRGVGCSKSYADNWIAHQDDFNSILALLNQSSTDPDTEAVSHSVLSLEAKSKTSKGRMHYQKFAKGKDLSSRSAEDLNCIFGVRKSKSESNTPQCQSEDNSDCDAPKEEIDTSGLKTIRSSDSVQEYFARKMAALKNSRSNQPDSRTEEDAYNQSDSRTEMKKSRFSQSDSVMEEDDKQPGTMEGCSEVHFLVGEDDESMQKSKKFKKKKKKSKQSEKESEKDREVRKKYLQQEQHMDTSMITAEQCFSEESITQGQKDKDANIEVHVVGDVTSRSKKRKESRKGERGRDEETQALSPGEPVEKKKKKNKKSKNDEEVKGFEEERIGEEMNEKYEETGKDSTQDKECTDKAKGSESGGRKKKKSKKDEDGKSERVECPTESREGKSTELLELYEMDSMTENRPDMAGSQVNKNKNAESKLYTYSEDKIPVTNNSNVSTEESITHFKSRRKGETMTQSELLLKRNDQKAKAVSAEFRKRGANLDEISGYTGNSVNETGLKTLSAAELKKREKNKKRKMRKLKSRERIN